MGRGTGRDEPLLRVRAGGRLQEDRHARPHRLPARRGHPRLLLTVARDLGYGSEEGRISIDQWRDDTANGTLTEVFACGTAAVITPVGTVKTASGEWTQGDGTPGEVTMKLRERLLDVQRGIAEDTHGWMHPLG